MDVTFLVDGDAQTILNVVEVERVDDEYVVRIAETKDGRDMLTHEDIEERTVSGHLVGVANVYENWGSAGVYSETCAIRLSTEGRVDVPEMPLSESSSLSDEEWEYDEHHELKTREIEVSDDNVLLRNVDTFALTDAIPADSKVDHWYRVNAEDGGFAVSTEPFSSEYIASFGSGWSSATLVGTVERISMYVDDDTIHEEIRPTEETRERAQWAFP